MLYRVSWDDILTDSHKVFYFHGNEKAIAANTYKTAAVDPLCKNVSAHILTCKVQFQNYKKKTYTYLCDMYDESRPKTYKINGESVTILCYEYKTKAELMVLAKRNNFDDEQYKILEVR